MTGLAAGLASGLPVYEAAAEPGGICRSYALAPPGSDDPYTFEVGGGHWIFGGDASVLRLLESFGPMRGYERRAAVYLTRRGGYVPYPLQYHLHALDPAERARALREIERGAQGDPPAPDLASWLQHRFGPTLGALFFDPFHERYTAGLWREVAVEDREKTPLSLDAVRRGARGSGTADSADVGYNARFVYPECGLGELASRMGRKCVLKREREAVRIDLAARRVHFGDGSEVGFTRLVSTLPLDRTVTLCGLDLGPPDPCTSVRVLNVGARRGPACPPHHWVYVSHSRAGFHRVGFYSNVDERFLPARHRGSGTHVALYVERAVSAGRPRDAAREAREDRATLDELRSWGFIGDVEVSHATHVEAAYTWVRPGSRWRERAREALAERGVVACGRYGAWRFQGIARSIRDGLRHGAALRASVGG